MSEEPGSERTSFEERLRATRERHGLESAPPPVKEAGNWGASPLGVGLRVGLELVTALVVAIAIGWGLDWLLGTRPVFLVLFIPLGGAAGVLNVWRIYAPRRADSGSKRD